MMTLIALPIFSGSAIEIEWPRNPRNPRTPSTHHRFLVWVPPPPQGRLIDAGLLRMNTRKRSGGKGNNNSRVFRGFRG